MSGRLLNKRAYKDNISNIKLIDNEILTSFKFKTLNLDSTFESHMFEKFYLNEFQESNLRQLDLSNNFLRIVESNKSFTSLTDLSITYTVCMEGKFFYIQTIKRVLPHKAKV